MDLNAPKDDAGLGALFDEVMTGKKKEDKPKPPPVYTARLPFRRCIFLGSSDRFSYATWAGLRPMSELEYDKACRGPLHPVPLEEVWGEASKRRPHPPVPFTAKLLDGACRPNASTGGTGSTPSRFAWAALPAPTPTGSPPARPTGASWICVPRTWCRWATRRNARFVERRADGRSPAGNPRGSLTREQGDVFETVPEDWPDHARQCGSKGGPFISDRGWVSWEHCAGSRNASGVGRFVLSAPRPGPRSAAQRVGTASEAVAARSDPAKPAVHADSVKVTNVRLESGGPGKDFVTFDLAWKDSWRAAWTEPADKNVTGKPLEVESWDAVWVFVKFRMPGATEDEHATLAAEKGDHTVPDGAALEVGLDDDGERGLGVFIYRNAAGHGPSDFRNVKLRWTHPGRPELRGCGRADRSAKAVDQGACRRDGVCARGPVQVQEPVGPSQ